MTNTPTLWKDMTDAEKGTLLLACHNGETLQSHFMRGWSDLCTFEPRLYPRFAYRIKPKTPKVETHEHRCHVWLCGDASMICPKGHITGAGLGNITHTYTITDGVVTACNTIIHNNGEVDQ